jgi:hypothetical protein
MTKPHLRILWGTPDRQLSHPPAECRLLGLGTDSACNRMRFLVMSYRSTHGHTAHSCRQRYCAGICSDLNKWTDITTPTNKPCKSVTTYIPLTQQGNIARFGTCTLVKIWAATSGLWHCVMCWCAPVLRRNILQMSITTFSVVIHDTKI